MDFKTPISLLQEYLVKEGVLPTYQLLNCGNAGSHEPTFSYEAKAKGVSATGNGRSKKEAKQKAAKGLLLKLKGETICKEEVPICSPHESVKTNLVGALQEYCAQHSISLPYYELVNDEGSAIIHNFVLKCTVGSYFEFGKASTKQQAKHLAAQAMLSKLKSVEGKVMDMSLNSFKDKKELTDKAYSKTKEAFLKTIHERNDSGYSSTNSMKDLINFSDYFINKITSHSSSVLASLKNIEEDGLKNLKDPEGFLNRIMDQLGFKLHFEFLASKSENNLCNLTIKELNFNCIGIDKSKSDAKKKAVMNVIEVLVVMSKT